MAAAHELFYDEKWKFSHSHSKRGGGGGGGSGRSNASLLRNSSSTAGSSSERRKGQRSSFTRRCARLVKEQRARFYIMRRCVTMLLCWRDYSDS